MPPNTSTPSATDQATRMVAGSLDRGRLGRRDRWAYERTAPAMVATLDGAMESFLYEPHIRQGFGLRSAVNLYAGTGVVTNSLYAKLHPTNMVRAVACAAMLATSRAWTRCAHGALSRLASRSDRGSTRRPPASERLETWETTAEGARVGVGG